MLRDARNPEIATHEESLGFLMGNMKALEKTRERLASRIDGQLLKTYERVSRKSPRVIVRVEGGVCQGCRMSLPTSSASRGAPVGSLENCQNCGRILYRL